MFRSVSALTLNPDALPQGRALVGVSGGKDSVALLHLLMAEGFRDLVVCHLDHGLRAESTEDAAFVRDLAAGLGLPLTSERVDVAAAAEKESIETAARRVRYEFFARQAREHGCAEVLLAHHADDQVETFLFNLLRGSGAQGLAGMCPRSVRVVEGVELQLLRPLLGTWREEIEQYVADHHLGFREDASNLDRRHTRNRMRHDLLPALESAIGRPVKRSIWRSAEILRAEQEWIEQQVPRDLAEREELPVGEVRELPLPIQRRLLLNWLRARKVPDVSFEDVESVRGLLTALTPAKVNLAAGFHARRRAGKLFLERAGE